MSLLATGWLAGDAHAEHRHPVARCGVASGGYEQAPCHGSTTGVLANRDVMGAIPYPEAMPDTVTLDLDVPTAAYLRICAQRDGGTLTSAAAHQLRQLAFREAVKSLGRWYAAHPSYAEDSEEETLRAIAEA